MASSEAQHRLEECIAGFDEFLDSANSGVVHFIRQLGIEPSLEVLEDAPAYLPNVAAALMDLVASGADDRQWLVNYLGFYIGEYFCQAGEGCWFVQEIESSRLFARYVVGQFSRGAPAGACIDPFEIAAAFTDQPTPRDLLSLVADVEANLWPSAAPV